jgi:hypothetical protein
VTGGIARLLLAAAMLCFNGPRLAGPDVPMHRAVAEHVDTRSDGSKPGFHVTVTVGRGTKQVTVEFGRARERAEDDVL